MLSPPNVSFNKFGKVNKSLNLYLKAKISLSIGLHLLQTSDICDGIGNFNMDKN